MPSPGTSPGPGLGSFACLALQPQSQPLKPPQAQLIGFLSWESCVCPDYVKHIDNVLIRQHIVHTVSLSLALPLSLFLFCRLWLNCNSKAHGEKRRVPFIVEPVLLKWGFLQCSGLRCMCFPQMDDFAGERV